MEQFGQIMGYLGAFLTTVSFVPQALKVIREKETHALSLKAYCLFSLGVFFWLIYGITISSIQIMVANSITLTLTSIIIAMKLKYK